MQDVADDRNLETFEVLEPFPDREEVQQRLCRVSCCPSPALITLARTQRDNCSGAPEDQWRTTIASTPIASRVQAVSLSDSPFVTEERASAEKLMTSAERRLAASSNEIRVRVDGS